MGPVHLPLKKVWNLPLASKIQLFAWCLLKGPRMTADPLASYHILNSINCACCLNVPETIDHMFLSCPLAQKIWEKLVSNRLISRKYFTLSSFGGWFWNSSNSDCMIAMLVAWYIWKARKNLVFSMHPIHPSSTALSVEFYTTMECDHHRKSFTNLKNFFPYSMVTSSPK